MSAIPTPFTGGCACGAIRYEASAQPIAMVHCHCRDCQRSSGGPFSSFVVLPDDALRFTQGTLKIHDTPSEAGGKNHRGFCSACGSPIRSQPDAAPQVVAVWTGSLDDPSWFAPQCDVWTSDAHVWDSMNPRLAKFDKYPTATS
jgi:hypothetical protein